MRLNNLRLIKRNRPKTKVTVRKPTIPKQILRWILARILERILESRQKRRKIRTREAKMRLPKIVGNLQSLTTRTLQRTKKLSHRL